MQVEDLHILVLSPHLDDAVLGIGNVISAAHDPIVATIFAGDPGDVGASSWDSAIGDTASEATILRRNEDIDAMRLLGATAVHLGFLEASYRSRFGCHETRGSVDLFSSIRREIVDLLDAHEPDAVVIPVGLHHIDHLITTTAGISASLTDRRCDLWAYAEQPYADFDAAFARRRVRGLRAVAVPLEFSSECEHLAAKVNAVRAYRSQIEPLQRVFPDWDPAEPISEQLWQLLFDPAIGGLPVVTSETASASLVEAAP
jgi:LmbE family N-acetylglucosaminyl deacetylase